MLRNAKRLWISSLLAIALAMAADDSVARADSSSLKLQTFKSHSRLTLRVDESVPVEWRSLPGGFELTLKGIGLADLGAPLGEEAAWKTQFESMADARVRDLKFEEFAGGVRVRGTWKFPTGPDAPAKPQMERFDFRDKEPARYVIDFWLKEGPTVAEVEAARIRAAREAQLRAVQEKEQKRVDRRLATERKRSKIKELGKFCERKLDEKHDIFLEFLPAHEPVDFGVWFPATTPDRDYPYRRPTAKGEDAQYARMALDLYKSGKFALAIRTIDFFEEENRRSPLFEEMRFLKVNSMIRLGMEREAEPILQQILVDFKSPHIALQVAMYQVLKQVEARRHLPALESFLWLQGHFPDHTLGWVFHLGAAEMLFAIKQTERASKEYQQVIEKAPDVASKAQGALRMGDLYMDRAQYAQALATYFQGIKYFADEAKKFPTIHLNRAEALYQLGEYAKAKEAFEQFLEAYPVYPAGWRAAFRMGEMYGRGVLGPESGEGWEERSRDWFLQAINRYPFSAGATLARARLIPCGDHAGFSLEAQERFFNGEARAFTGQGDIKFGTYDDFRALAHVRGVMNLGREETTVDAGLKEIKTVKREHVRREISIIINDAFRKKMQTLLKEGKNYEALAFYRQRSEDIPRDESGIEPEYLLKLSQVASDMGLGNAAQEIAAAYQKGLKEARRANGESDRALASSNPDGSIDMDTELKLSEGKFTEAKAQFISAGAKEAAAIRAKLAQVREESRFSFERELILGLLDDAEDKPASALSHAAKAQLLAAGGKADLRLEYWVATLHARAGESRAALELLRNLEKRLKLKTPPPSDPATVTLGVPAPPSIEAVLMAQADILEKQSKWGDAAATYGRAVEDGIGGNQALFSYARALLKTNDQAVKKKAFAALETLAAKKAPANDDFWIKMAQETLANEKTQRTVRGDAKEGTND